MIQTDLVGARLEIRSTSTGIVLIAGACRGVAMNESDYPIFLIVDDAGRIHTMESLGYSVYVVPADDPLTRACAQCGSGIGEACRVMTAGCYHAVRKAT